MTLSQSLSFPVARRVAPFWRPRLQPLYDSLWLPTPNSVGHVYSDQHFTVNRFVGDPSSTALTSVLQTHRCVFIDPGVRTFLTFYSPDGLCGTIHHDAKDVDPELDYAAMEKAACQFLCVNFDAIFLPRLFEGPPAMRAASTMHRRFRSRLTSYARRCNKVVYAPPEHYTTQTCGRCGCCNKIGGAKTYACPRCGFVIDRDMNAARNICLLVLTLTLEASEARELKGARPPCTITETV